MFNLITIYLNVSMQHLVPWKIQGSYILVPEPWHFSCSSLEINNNVKDARLNCKIKYEMS